MEIIAQGPWEGEKRLLELCGSLWALPKPPAGQFLSCFNTICLPSFWSKSWPKLPKPSWVCTSPEQSQSALPKIQQKMHQVHPIRALWKTSGGYFGEGTDSGAWYTEGFTVFLFKDYFALLCHKIETLWLIFYTECLQNVWANLVIYLFFKLDYFHSDSFFNSKNPRIFYKYKAPEWHCWLGLMHIEPLHCFKENLKKKPPREATKIHQSSPKLSRSASLEISRHFTESTQWCCQLALDGTFCFKKLFYNLQPGWFVFFVFFFSLLIRITGILKTPEKCQHCSKRFQGGWEVFKQLLRLFQGCAGVLHSTSDALLLLGHRALLLSAVVFPTLGF